MTSRAPAILGARDSSWPDCPAAEMGKPVALVNRGKTRADDLAHLKVEGDCGEVLHDLVRNLG